MKYARWDLGQIEALINRLGEDNARKLLDCSEVNVTFSANCKRATVSADTPALKVWRKLKLGTGIKTPDDFRKAIAARTHQVYYGVSDLLGREGFNVAAQEMEVNLVIKSAKDLGFTGNARSDQIWARATELGLELCPAEVGPQLLLQDLDQWVGKWLVVAMEPILDSSNQLKLFAFEPRNDKRWFTTVLGRPDREWSPDTNFVFVSPR